MNRSGRIDRKKAQETAHKLDQRKNKTKFAEAELLRK